MARHAIERKVRWATAASYLASSGLLGVLAAVQDNGRVVEPLPGPVSSLVLALVPGLLTFVAGWKAGHTPRAEGG
ncbi:holin [Streptomyces sp. NPDC086782]|uniref:holin n=1 Tax=Streptomyces sp. NPDC086782 TaxID=3365757 RepID=UPI0037F916B2